VTQNGHSTDLATVDARRPLALGEDENPRAAMIAWLAEWSSPKKRRARCVVFSLSKISATDEEGEGITHVEAPRDDDALAMAADEFWRAAKVYAASAGARTGFVIRGHQKPSSLRAEDGSEADPLHERPRVGFPFHCTPPRGTRENFEGGESPTASGVVGAQQRHADAVLRSAVPMSRDTAELLLEFNRDLMRQVKELTEEKLDSYERIEDLADRKVARELAVKEGTFNLQIKETVAEIALTQILPIVSLVVKSKLGIVDVPPGEAAGPALLEQVKALKLKPKQLAKFVRLLEPEQRDLINPLVYAMLPEMPESDQKAFRAQLKIEEDEEAAERGSK
jgi:hypothetical protein